MKIVIANNKFYRRGGPETYLFNFMELAENHGHEIIPFALQDSKNIETEYKRFFVPNGNVNESSFLKRNFIGNVISIFFNIDAYRSLRKLIRYEKPDLVYIICQINGLSPSIIAAAKAEGVPVIHRFSDFFIACPKYSFFRDENICVECMHGHLWRAVKHMCIKNSKPVSLLRIISMYFHRAIKVYNKIDAFISPSIFTKNLLITDGCLSGNQIYHIPTFISYESIVPSYENESYVLCLGRFSAEKGFIYVIESLKHLRDIPVKVYITGKIEDGSPELLNIIKEHKLVDRIHFTGFVHGPALDELIDNAMCIVCPSIWFDNMPNVVLEAYAHGKPVIASRLGSLIEVLDDGVTGLLFTPKDVEQIADCIRKLYVNPQFTMTMGQNARRKCEIEYAPELHWERFIDVCKKIGV